MNHRGYGYHWANRSSRKLIRHGRIISSTMILSAWRKTAISWNRSLSVKPLTALDIERGLKLLAWSRADLLSVLDKLTPDQWTYKKEGERWDITGIVNHISGGELWYLDRFGLAPSDAYVPQDTIERLAKVRDVLVERLPSLEGSKQVLGLEGEFWSPRKLLRRAVWHERDHTEHIQKLLRQL